MVIPLGDSPRAGILPVVTYGIILVNVAVYLVEIARGPVFITTYAATPWEIVNNRDIQAPGWVQTAGGQPREVLQGPSIVPVRLTLFTSLFLHDGPLHLVINMLFLWIYGDNVEEALGRGRYLAFYLACGVLGAFVQVLAAPDSPIPILGASGAIAGVMGLYAVLFPYNRVRVWFIRIFEVPAIAVIGLWVMAQVLRELGLLGSFGGVAYLSHITGASIGIAVGMLERARRERPRAQPG